MKYVMDTSAFTSVRKNAAQTKRYIRELAKFMLEDKRNKYYIPKTVWHELEILLRNKCLSEKCISELGEALMLKQPSRMELLIPAQFVNDYVNELRVRINKGLKEAEKLVLMKSGGINRPDDEVIREVREKYRTLMRQGMLDSEEDLDVLLLAKEINGTIVANDEGIEKWADKWGVHYIRADRFCGHVKREA